jgi:hypothetical protein
LGHQDDLDLVDSIRALEFAFDKDIDEVFGDRAQKFQPKLRELLFEFWMSARKKGAEEARAKLFEENLKKSDWVEELGDLENEPITDAFEDRLIHVMTKRGTPLHLLQERHLSSGNDLVPMFMNKSSGKVIGVEEPHKLVQGMATEYFQTQQFVTSCISTDNENGFVWKLKELGFARLPDNQSEITGVWVDSVLTSPGDWMTMVGSDSNSNLVITEIHFIAPQLPTAEVMVHWVTMSSSWGFP